MSAATLSTTAMRLLVIASAAHAVGSFSITNHLNPHQTSYAANSSSSSRLSMATGMGMATKNKDKKKKKAGSKNSKGMGKKSSDKKPSDKYDISKAMIKQEKLYNELMSESIKALNAADEWDEAGLDITTEYIIAARCKPGSTLVKANSAIVSASDWIPVAQVCIVRPIHLEESDVDGSEMNSSVRAAVSYYCREINYAATLAAPSTFKSIPRSIIEYSAEPVDSFVKFVYEDVIEGKAGDSFVGEGGSKVGMTKTKAREILGLESGCKDAAIIKQAYKKQSMALHPDRFINSDKTREEIDESSNQFGLVKMAYEALNSGVREVNGNGVSQSWYESLGGKSRTEFAGPIDLLSVEKATAFCNKAFKSAVVGLDPDLTMAFVARNQAAAR
ncbi:hypothetical protein ACHAXR_009416 [Thalassiosira sp. AJA248-18]